MATKASAVVTIHAEHIVSAPILDRSIGFKVPASELIQNVAIASFT